MMTELQSLTNALEAISTIVKYKERVESSDYLDCFLYEDMFPNDRYCHDSLGHLHETIDQFYGKADISEWQDTAGHSVFVRCGDYHCVEFYDSDLTLSVYRLNDKNQDICESISYKLYSNDKTKLPIIVVKL